MANASEGGFTLIEIVIALVLIGIIAATMYPAVNTAIEFKQRLATESAAKQLAADLKIMYQQKAYTIDASAGATIPTGTTTIQTGAATQAEFADVMQLVGKNPSMILDGFNRPFQIFVSDPLHVTIQGVPITYHVIALVSNQGGQYNVQTGQTLNAGTKFDPTTGELKLAGQDYGVLVSGLPIEMAKVKEAKAQLQRIASVYQQYFQSRYLANASRALSTDYWGYAVVGNAQPASWDSSGTGEVTASCGVAKPDSYWGYPATSLNLDGALGLGPADYTDPWGHEIRVENCGSGPRNPNGSAGQTTPPYTAELGVRLPGGGLYRITDVGSY